MSFISLRVSRRTVVAGALALSAAIAASASPALAANVPVSATLHPTLATGSGAQSAPAGPVSHPLRVRDPAQYAREKAAANRRYDAWAATHPSASPLFGTPLSIASLNKPGLSAAGAGGGTPPDTTGAIGPSSYLEFVNSEIAVYSRTTLATPPISSASEDSFVLSSSTCDGQIKWDQAAHRFEYYSLDCGASPSANGFSFGWSKTASPTPLTGASSNWCKFHVNTGTNLEDYGKLGNYNSFMIIGTNEFANAASYAGSPIFTIKKPANGSTSCAVPTLNEFSPSASTEFTPEPANVFGSSATGYVVAINPDSSHLRMFTVTGTTAPPTVTDKGNITVPAFSVPADVKQPGTSNVIDSSDTRLTQAAAALDPTQKAVAVWTQHTIASGTVSAVRWYELLAGKTTPLQTGTISSSGAFAFNGAVAPDSQGSGAGFDYNLGSATAKVAVRARIHAASGAAGSTTGDVLLATSPGIDQDFSCGGAGSPCRWGDYAGASTDPLCAASVWGSNQFNGAVSGNNAAWATQNFRLNVDECPVAAFTVTPTSPKHGSPATFDGSASSDPDGSIASYTWIFGDGVTSTLATPTTTHTYAAAGTFKVTLTVKDSSGLSTSVSHNVVVG